MAWHVKQYTESKKEKIQIDKFLVRKKHPKREG